MRPLLLVCLVQNGDLAVTADDDSVARCAELDDRLGFVANYRVAKERIEGPGGSPNVRSALGAGGALDIGWSRRLVLDV